VKFLKGIGFSKRRILLLTDHSYSYPPNTNLVLNEVCRSLGYSVCEYSHFGDSRWYHKLKFFYQIWTMV
jgi:hypothetical protein